MGHVISTAYPVFCIVLIIILSFVFSTILVKTVCIVSVIVT